MTTPPRTHAQLEGDVARLRRQVEVLEPLSARAEEAEDEFARFFEQSLDLLCIAGLDGYFKRLNPAWEGALGWAREELEARPFIDFVHPEDRRSTLAQVARLAQGGDVAAFENRYRHRDGCWRWLRWSARSVPGRRRIFATARDVTRQKRLERQILEVADRERQHLGQELHDGLCQTLAGIAGLSAALSRDLAAGAAPSTAAAVADEISGLIGAAIVEIRGLAHGLHPVGLKETGLYGPLEALASSVEHAFGVPCGFEPQPPYCRLDSAAEVHLFRIAQEAVSNALTHGRPDRVDIGLSWEVGGDPEREYGLLSVRDDGVGLPEDASEADGIGLHTMDYRARSIDACLEVRRRAGGGTAVLCAFPLSVPGES